MSCRNPDAVADMVDDAADIQEDMEEISTVLAEPMGQAAFMDDDELMDDFLADLEAEQGLGIGGVEPAVQLPDVSHVNPFPQVATAPVAAPVAAPEDMDDDEFAALEAQFA